MPHHVFIHVPAFGEQITRTTFHATHALRDYLHFKGMATGINSMSFPDIAELRAMVTTIWFDTMQQSDYLLFVDADMGFPPEHVGDMIMFNEPLIGTIYRQRKEPISWAGSGNGAPETARRGNFIQVEGVGFGCTLIKREVIGTMLQKMPELADYRIALHPAGDTLRGAGANRLIRAFEKMDIADRGLISEDLSFCIRWARCGGQTWAHVGSTVSHVGPYDFAGCYLHHVEQLTLHAQQLAAQQAASQASLIQLPQFIPLQVKPLPQEISTYTVPPPRAGTEAIVLPNGRDGAPAMSDPPPAGLEEKQLEAAE